VDFLNAQFRKKRLRGAVVALFLLGALVPHAFAQTGLVPSITVQPLDQAVKKGGTAVFTVEASSLTSMSYQWYRNSNAIAGATGSTYTRANLDFPDAGFYHVVVANLIGPTKSDVVYLTVLPNTAPVGVNDTFSTPEDVPLVVPTGGILSNDTDADGDALTALLVTNVTRGTLTFSTNGGFTYRPSTNYNGSDSFAYRPRDSVATGNIATVTINILPINDAPIANNDSTNTVEDVSVTIKVLLNDSDPEGSPLSITGVSTTNGTAFASGTNIVFTPGTNFNGTVVLSYMISDGVDSDNANAVVTVTPVNDAVVANDDNYSTPEDVQLVVPAAGILANDVDVDNGGLAALLLSNATQGSLILNTNGSFSYTPNTNYSGTDSFTYCVRDRNDVPIILQSDAAGAAKVEIKLGQKGAQSFRVGAAGNPTYMVSKVVLYLSREAIAPNTNLNFSIGTGVNAGPIPGSSVSIAPSTITDTSSGATFQTYDVVFATPVGPLTAGTTYYLNLESEPSNGKRIWSAYDDLNNYPNGTYYRAGTDQLKDIKFQVVGSTNSNASTVTINTTPVYDPPLATNDSTNTMEDMSVTIPVLANDLNPENLPLLITTLSTTNGSAVVSNGTNVVFTPSPNFNGTAALGYTIDDGVSSSTASVTITVISVNDVPIANNDAYATLEDVPLAISAPGVLSNDADVDSVTLTSLLVSNVSNGSLMLNANGSFNYAPNPNYNGADSFSYRPRDGFSTGNVATVTISVAAVNDAPFAVNDSTNTPEDTSVTIKVLLNDSDVEGTPLVITGTSTTNGTAVISGTNIVFRPSTNFNGTAVFSYTISDGTNFATASVTVTVAAVNDAPVAGNDAYTVSEDVTLTVGAPGVLTNDGDVDSGALTALLVSNVSSGSLTLNNNGSFTYTPSPNYNGNDSFSYRANDGLTTGNVATVTINVTPVNDVPVANDDSTNTLEDVSVRIRVLANDTDVEGGPLAISTTSTTNGTAVISGSDVVFTPSSNYFGTVVFSYVLSDGTNSSTANVTINVISVNDAPPVATNDTYTTQEDTGLTVAAPGVRGNDWDVDGDPFTVLIVSNVTRGTLSLNANGSFNYTPNTNYSGTDSFTYRATDGMATGNVGTVTINVTPVNDTPFANSDSTNTLEDTSVTIKVLGNDTDVEGTALALTSVSTTNGTAVISGTNVLFTPSSNFFGTVVFSYIMTDGTNSATATVTVNVISVNDAPPVANNESYTTIEDTLLTVAAPGILANDTDVDADPITALLISGVSAGTLTFNTNGSFTYRPNTNFYGTDNFSYRATDGMAFGNLAIVTITVTPVNDVPLPIDDVTNTLEDTSVTIPVLVNDSDVEGTGLIITATSATNGAAIVSGSNIVFTPSTNFNGPIVFSYTVSDGTNFATASVTVTVIPVNDVPVAVNDAVTVLEDKSVTINVLANDNDVELAPLTVTSVSSTNGTAVISGTNIVYTPSANYFGTVSLDYTMSDGTNSATARVTVTVTSVNDAPIAADDSYSTDEDVRLTVAAPGILGNDTDVENNSLTALLVSSVSHGALTFSGNGAFIYTPATNYFGSDSFTYRVWDGTSNSAVTTVQLVTRLTTPLKIVSGGFVTNGFNLRLQGPSPAVYTILGSTNNIDWRPFGSRVALTGSAEYTDTNASRSSVCYYNAMVNPQSTIVLEQNTLAGNKVDLRPGKPGAQSFQHGAAGEADYTISKVVFYISRDSTAPNTNLNFSIGADINSGALAGSSVSISPSSITNTSGGSTFHAMEIIYSTPVGPLAAGVTYYLNLENEPPNGARVYVPRSGGSSYSLGTFFRGGSDQGYDTIFEIWGQ
jgi:VCBS repeat-containing protein